MADGARLSDEELANKRLIYPRMQDTKLLNIYRNLRTKLISAARGRNFICLVTSVVPGGGTSLISANIAASFAFDEGKTAMLIEGNVHSPSLANLFDLDADTRGLMDYLESEDTPVGDVMHETGIPRLRFIPSGRVRENSSEYFTSDKMKTTVEEIASRYPDRYPIVDAPSIQDSADARILLDLCDQVILVIPYGQCTEEEIKAAADTIGSEKLVGVVLNQF
ncbi:MAG: XRE family transcriptional regulator [Cellvibrionaceae bacterium]